MRTAPAGRRAEAAEAGVAGRGTVGAAGGGETRGRGRRLYVRRTGGMGASAAISVGEKWTAGAGGTQNRPSVESRAVELQVHSRRLLLAGWLPG